MKHAGRMWSPYSRGFEGFQRGKEATKKILVVYKLIFFHGFVFEARVAKQLTLTERSTAVCSGQALQHDDKTNCMEDGRWNMHCTVL